MTLTTIIAILLTIVSPLTRTASAQSSPNIYWERESLEINLAPGGAATNNSMTFVSNTLLQDVTFQPSAEIARFLYAYQIPIVSKNVRHNVFFEMNVPNGTSPGRYEGTVEVRSANGLIEQFFQPLRVIINVAPPSPSNSPGFTLFTNPTDPLLLRARTPDGKLIEYFGLRDAEGLTTSINSIKVKFADDRLANLTFDAEGRLTQFAAPNGLIINFLWVSATRALVTAIAPSGARVNVPFEMPATATRAIFESLTSQLSEPQNSVTSSVPFTVNITRCGGRPVNGATVELLAYPINSVTGLGDPLVVNATSSGSGGVYTAVLPSPAPSAGAAFQTQCQSVSQAIGEVCNIFGAIPADVLQQLTASLVAAAVAIPGFGGIILAAVATLIEAVDLACNLKADRVIERIAAVLCERIAEQINRQLTEAVYRVNPRISNIPGVDGGPFFGEPQFYRPFQPSAPGVSPTFQIEIPDNSNCERVMRAVLSWDTNGTDVDLHVADSRGRHTFYGNPTGIPNSRLDVDDVDGYGPENFYLNPMESGVTYNVYLHYYADNNRGPTTANVKVFLDDELITDFTATLSNRQTINVGTYSTTTTVLSFADSISAPVFAHDFSDVLSEIKFGSKKQTAQRR